MNARTINSKVTEVLALLPEIILPIKIEELAMLRGLQVLPYELGDEVSGLLSIEDGKGIIGYNQSEPKVRRRFTIAHELGHYELHRTLSNMFVDKQIIYRSQNSSDTPVNQIMEKQANDFAAAILMPTDFVKDEVEKIKFDLGSDEVIKELSRIFDVSATAMLLRIKDLGLV